MEYKYGYPISGLLADYLKRHTHEDDIYPLLEKYKSADGKMYSKSTINQLRIGRIAVTETTGKFIDDLFSIAVENSNKERNKFKPLLKKLT